MGSGGGVGLVYQPELGWVIDALPGILTVLELEPESYWRAHPDGSLAMVPGLLDSLAGLSISWLIHSVTSPVGGSHPPDPRAREPLREVVAALRPAWISTHLSFTHARGPAGVYHSGFLLPPLQTAAGINAAVDSIRAFQDWFDIPVAVETGVNYLRCRPGEIPDGAFFAEVASRADCGLLVDLHNLWTNARNGRQPVEECLLQLPAERIWEVHVAGGHEFNGFWLDAHSGPVPPPVMSLAEEWIPRWPKLTALLFEIVPIYLSSLDPAVLLQQMERLAELWARRAAAAPVPVRSAGESAAIPMTTPPSPVEVVAYEESLAALASGRPWADRSHAFAVDPGVEILRTLVEQVRGGRMVEVMRFTCRAVLLHEGPAGLRRHFGDFWGAAPPEAFPYDEAQRFAAFLRGRDVPIPYIHDLIAFDLAQAEHAASGEDQVVEFHWDPEPLLFALGDGRLPSEVSEGLFIVAVTARSTDDVVEIPLRTIPRQRTGAV